MINLVDSKKFNQLVEKWLFYAKITVSSGCSVSQVSEHLQLLEWNLTRIQNILELSCNKKQYIWINYHHLHHRLNYTRTLIGSYIKMWQVHPWHTLLCLMCHFFVLHTFWHQLWSTQQHKIYLSNGITICFTICFTFVFCSWTHGCAMKTGSHL